MKIGTKHRGYRSSEKYHTSEDIARLARSVNAKWEKLWKRTAALATSMARSDDGVPVRTNKLTIPAADEDNMVRYNDCDTYTPKLIYYCKTSFSTGDSRTGRTLQPLVRRTGCGSQMDEETHEHSRGRFLAVGATLQAHIDNEETKC